MSEQGEIAICGEAGPYRFPCPREPGHDGKHYGWEHTGHVQGSPMGRNHHGVWVYDEDGEVVFHADFDGEPTEPEIAALVAITEVAHKKMEDA